MANCKRCNKKLAYNNTLGYCKDCAKELGGARNLRYERKQCACGKWLGLQNKTGLCASCIQKELKTFEKSDEKRKATCLAKYGTERSQSSEVHKQHVKDAKLKNHGDPNYNNQEKHKATCLEKYGVEHHWKAPEVLEKREKTNLERYGNEVSAKSDIVRAKLRETFANKSPEYWRELAIKTSKTRSSIPDVDGIACDSTWEVSFIETHPGCKRGPSLEYEDETGKKRHWQIDFEWEEKVYEVKNPWMLKPDNTWLGKSRIKFDLSKRLGIRWYLWKPGEWDWPKLDEVEEFRATKCHVDKLKNPWEGYNDPLLKFAAEENLAKYITWPGMFEKFVKKGPNKMLYERFTIAKIAPKVTVGHKNEAKRSLLEAISKWGRPEGVYNPCAGFGGWSIAAKELGLLYEGYDINPDLVRLFGWGHRDLLTMDPIETKYIVWSSPPVYDKETWGQDITSMSETEWYELIRKKVIAPHYVFVNGSDSKTGGLFGNKNRKVLFL